MMSRWKTSYIYGKVHSWLTILKKIASCFQLAGDIVTPIIKVILDEIESCKWPIM